MLAIHLLTAVGWIGAVSAYIVLVAVVLTSNDPRTVRDAILDMYPMVSFVIIPGAVVAYATGLLLAAATPWGLLRHWWVVFSLFLTSFGLFVLMVYSVDLRAMVNVAARPTLSSSDLAMLKDPGHAVHSLGGLSLLLTVAVINIYKPRGLTRRGWRQQQEAKASRRASALGTE